MIELFFYCLFSSVRKIFSNKKASSSEASIFLDHCYLKSTGHFLFCLQALKAWIKFDRLIAKGHAFFFLSFFLETHPDHVQSFSVLFINGQDLVVIVDRIIVL